MNMTMPVIIATSSTTVIISIISSAPSRHHPVAPTSNAKHDQRYKSDADEQRYERDGVVFEPMPITGKHDVLSLFQMDYENRVGSRPTRSSGGWVCF
jgi:hypothetical protein